MKEYKREHYILKAYNDERYRLDVYDSESNTEYSEYDNKWESLYMKAKKEVKKGKECHIFELKYEFL